MPPSARYAIAAALAWSLILPGGRAGSVEQWILVTPPAFRSTLTPLIQRRQSDGLEVVVLETTSILTSEQLRKPDGPALQARLKELVQGRDPRTRSSILLAGTSDSSYLTNGETSVVPGLNGKVGRMKDQPSDWGYTFPEPDGTPTVAVGRLPARSRDELRAMIQKILDFERGVQPEAWQSRLLLLLGNPGGGPLAEMFVGQSLAKDLALLQPAWDARIMFNAASSPYYLPRPLDRETALRFLKEGQLFSVYLGHSDASGLGLDGRFITSKDFTEVSIPQGRGPFFTCGCFACQTGARDGDGYGMAAMRNPAGPVAVIGASGESYSAPGQLAAEGLLSCLAQPPFPTRLGDYWLAVQSGLARGKMDDATFALLDMADGTADKVPLATQRLEHLEMWMLLGDPAMRLPIVPVDISLKASEPVAGSTLTVEGTLPDRLSNATVRVTLERPLNSKPAGLEKPPAATPDNREARLRAITANFERANSFTLAATETKSPSKSFTASLEVPANLPWTNLILRASAALPQKAGLGILRLTVNRAEP